MTLDILLTHGYFLYDDPHELAVMKPYPPLGLLYICSHLKARGLAVDVFDTHVRASLPRSSEAARPSGRRSSASTPT